MRNFRLLRPDEIECRVARVTEKSVQLLLYKTARTDSALLDETVGSLNWQNDYKVIDGKMYCGVGVKDKDTCQWVWKWNCGTESNMEQEKGQASDAFKRAGFVWGIGAELYSSPQIYVPIAKCNVKGGKCYDTFEVTSIGYDKAENINALVISIDGQPVWNMGTAKKVAEKPKAEPKEAPKAKKEEAPPPHEDEDLPFIFKEEPGGKPEVFNNVYVCSSCRKEITPKVAKYSYDKFGKYLCYNCQR